MKSRICLTLLFLLVLSGFAIAKKPSGNGGSGSNEKQASFEIFTPLGSGLTSDGGGIYEQSEDEPGVAAYFNGAQNAVLDLDDRLSSV